MKPRSLYALLAWTLVVQCAAEGATRTTKGTNDKPYRVAIVGSGIGGAVTAEYLRRSFKAAGAAIEIVVYEQSERVCGRLAVAEVDGGEYDAGGAIIHPRNQIMRNLTEKLGLERVVDDPMSTRLAVFDAESRRFAFQQTGSWLWDSVSALWTYGWSNLNALDRTVAALLRDFDNIYALQAQGAAFATVSGLLDAMGGDAFVQMLHTPLRSYLESHGVGDPLLSDFAGMAMCVNYAQHVDAMHAFVGMVSLAGVQDGLWRIRGGNGRICAPLLALAGAEIRLQQHVQAVERRPSAQERAQMGRYTIVSTSRGSVRRDRYDGIVMASPLQLSGVQLVGFENGVAGTVGDEGEYQQCVATFIASNMGPKPEFFGKDANDAWSGGGVPPDAIFATRPSPEFISCNRVPPCASGGSREENAKSRVWKIFSQEPLSPEQIRAIFGDAFDVEAALANATAWRAYPRYDGWRERRISPLSLADDGAVAYVSPVEWAASAMEMSAIGGVNAANLVTSALLGKGSCSLGS